MYRTRGARGGSKLNRTLHESPATASLHSATPKRKNVSCSFVFRGGGFFLKWKGHFSFWGSALQVFGQVAGLQFGRAFAKTIFWGKDFAKARLIYFGGSSDFVRAEEGFGEESARAFSDFFGDYSSSQVRVTY